MQENKIQIVPLQQFIDDNHNETVNQFANAYDVHRNQVDKWLKSKYEYYMIDGGVYRKADKFAKPNQEQPHWLLGKKEKLTNKDDKSID